MMSKTKIRANLGVGPMSSEVIEAVFRYSHYHRKELMLIASKNQIDYRGGYVNNWVTGNYLDYVEKLRKEYVNAKVYLCRDHCGPGFNGVHKLDDVYKTIEDDIKNGFDLIHIDFCHHRGTRDERLKDSKKAIAFCLKLNPAIALEVGTDENTGTNYSLPNIREIEREVEFFKEFCDPEFFVVQTGSLVREMNQAGTFNKNFVDQAAKSLRKYNVKLKEHNGDYLTKKDIALRSGLVDAINIAPQLGVVQSQFVLGKCLAYGVKFDEFFDEVYRAGKWKKWAQHNPPEDKLRHAIIAGHYHFASAAYRGIIEQLAEVEDIRDSIVNEIIKVIELYEENFT